MDKDQLKEQLLRHEGLRLKPYYCSVGKLTIGVARNLDDVGITKEEAMYLFENDIRRSIIELYQVYPLITDVPTERYYALVNMAFNLGIPKLMGFEKMWAAIKRQDWNLAADEALDSRWADQVGLRADELAEQLRTGVYKEPKRS